ncbi:MAG: PHB depolymerase family esterase, partial [Alphaproteobacteria bacterium]
LTTRDRAHRENNDDVKFIKTLVDVVDRQHATVDYTRIYAIGISNGGMMTLRLACEAPDRFRAVAAFTANLPEPVPPLCRAAVAVGVLMMNGTADPLVPYDGGQVRFGRRTLGAVISTDATMALFARRNGCTAQPSTTDLPDVDPADQTRVVRLEWTGCRAPVVLYRIDGGGHTWPGRAQYLPQFMVGKVSRDIDGTEVAWAFLKAQARR